jgi:hypothetical protein
MVPQEGIRDQHRRGTHMSRMVVDGSIIRQPRRNLAPGAV